MHEKNRSNEPFTCALQMSDCALSAFVRRYEWAVG